MINKFYFMGIKGVGMASLAIVAKQAGFDVTGSDIEEEFITDSVLKSEGIKVLNGFDEQNVVDFFAGTSLHESLFVATGAHEGFDNPESQKAKSLGIKVVSHGEALGMFMNGKVIGRDNLYGISIAGAHGKTTVSSMVATVLTSANTDPSYAIGTSEIFPLGPAAHYGLGRNFIAEADEYFAELRYQPVPKFLYQKPQAIIVNNIDFDHPDVYRDLDALKNAYSDFIDSLPQDGILVVNGDDSNTMDVVAKKETGAKLVTFGTDLKNEFILYDYSQDGIGSRFSIKRGDMNLGEFKLSVPGYHNAKNATGVVALCIELGIAPEAIKKGLAQYKGVKRRLEMIGKTQYDQVILDDYAHHPEEIRKTLEAIKAAYPDKKLITVFQFHTFSRTKALFNEFVSSLSASGELILLPTFVSERHEKDSEGIDQKIVDEFVKMGKHVALLPDIASVVKYIGQNFKNPDTVILSMGAGRTNKAAYLLAIKS